MIKDKIIYREERVAIIEPGRRELWRVYYGPDKARLIVKHLGAPVVRMEEKKK